MTKTQTARMFLARKSARCHNASTNGSTYTLHNSIIAKWLENGSIEFSFCGHFTSTTSSHINEILKQAGATKRVSYAQARDGKQPETFTMF